MATNMRVGDHEYYRMRKTIGHKVVDGEKIPIRKAFTGRNKTEAERKYRDWLLSRSDHEEIEDTFGDLAAYYTENVLPNDSRYAKGTQILYAGAYQLYVRPMKPLLSTPISSVDIKTLQNAILGLQQTQAQSVPKNVAKWMKAFYKWASISGYCDDISKALVSPSSHREVEDEIAFWDDDSLQMLLDFMEEENHRLRFFVIFAVNTGLRVAEIMALTYDDIKDGYVTVNKQYQHNAIRKPKSQDSYRSVPLNDLTREEFEKYHDWHLKEMKRRGYSTNIIFSTKTGHYQTYSILRRSLERTYKRIQEYLEREYPDPEERPEFVSHSIHAFRATFATNLAHNGVRLEVARRLLGHSSIEVTAKYYTAVTDRDKEEAVAMI